jgi:hypothetical protein
VEQGHAGLRIGSATLPDRDHVQARTFGSGDSATVATTDRATGAWGTQGDRAGVAGPARPSHGHGKRSPHRAQTRGEEEGMGRRMMWPPADGVLSAARRQWQEEGAEERREVMAL